MTDADDAPAKREPTARNAALWGLVGTLVGGVIGLTGTYIGLRQEADLDEKATKRAAISAFLLEAGEYRGHLRLLREAAETGDAGRYDEARTAAQNAGGELFAAAGIVRIVAGDATGRAASDVNNALIAVEKPEDLGDYDVAAVTQQVDAVHPIMDDFLTLARLEIGAD